MGMRHLGAKKSRIFLAVAMALVLAFVLACPLLTFADTSTTSTATSNARRTVRMGVADTDSNSQTGSGATEAFEKDYVLAIAEYAGWDVTYVNASWSDCLQMLKDGDIDVLTDVSMTDERLAYYDFSSESMGTEMCYLYGRGDTNLQYDDFAAFNGMKVGYEDGSTIFAALEEYAAKKGFTVTGVPYENGTAMFAGLDAGEVDAVVQTNFYDTPTGHVILAKCSPSPVYIATTKTDPTLIDELDDGMAKLLSYNPNFNYDIYNYHYGSEESKAEGYTQTELNYLVTHPVVNVYYETNWEPFEYDESGQAEGITPDVIRAIGDDTGITFNFVLSSSTQDVYTQVGGESTDTVMAVSYDYLWADSHDLQLTQPYVNGSVIRVTKSASTDSKTVAVVTDGYLATQVAKAYPNLEPVEYLTFGECMDAVARGDADCTFINYYQASDYRAKSSYDSLIYQPDSKITQGIALGVTKESNPALFSILSKSLEHISSSSLKGIINEDSVSVEPLTFQVLLNRYPAQVAIISSVLCVAIALVVGLMITAAMRKRKNRELAIAKAEADAANAAKSEFLSRMSHDMRTPLNGIIGMTYLTQEMDLPQSARENLEKIDTSSKFLLSLINDVLDMTKAESGAVVLHPEPHPFDEFLGYVDAVFKPLCEEKGLTLVMDVVQTKGVVPLMDVLRMNQVLFNLFSNAVKYTPEGGKVTFGSHNHLTDDNRLAMEMVVSDNGLGMSEEFQKILFDPFSQEDHRDNDEMRGTGLGLAIVKHLVDVMGGTIRVESELGKGSTFILDFEFDCVSEEEARSRAATSAKSEAQGTTDVDLNGVHILICEDHPINQEIAKAILEQKGAIVEIADDGQIGLRDFEQSSVGYYDCILMDIRMPIMDGYDTTHAIRALDRPDAAKVPIIAMTADAFSDDVQKCRDAGMTAHVAKPINPETLCETIARYLGR